MEQTIPIAISGFYYVTGQGGTPYSVSELANVVQALPSYVSGTVGETQVFAQVSKIGLDSGSLWNGTSTVYAHTNEIVLLLSTNDGGTIVEQGTGTISGTVYLSVTGY